MLPEELLSDTVYLKKATARGWTCLFGLATQLISDFGLKINPQPTIHRLPAISLKNPEIDLSHVEST